MDTKALAKSKRNHSLHHSKKYHPHQASKVASAATSGGKQQTQRHAGQKPERAVGLKALPSNWDRYHEGLGSDSEDVFQESSSGQATDIFVPKSKGADYAYLISEAKAQYQGDYSSDIFSSLNDVLDDFSLGLGPMLSARGQSILSSVSDDTFDFDDKSTTNHKVPFLSLNLNTLAEQLSKCKPSERLYIEADVLPPELIDELQDSSEHRVKLGQTSTVVDNASTLIRHSEEATKMQQNSNSPTIITSSLPVNQAMDESWNLGETSQRTSPDSTPQVNVESVVKRTAEFETADVEAELDFLLDSFGGTSFLESTSEMNKSDTLSHMPGKQTSAAFNRGNSSVLVVPSAMKKGADMMKRDMVPVDMNDTIDSLLEQNSTLINVEKGSEPLEVRAAPHELPSSLDPISKSKLLDDFDSWLDTI